MPHSARIRKTLNAITTEKRDTLYVNAAIIRGKTGGLYLKALNKPT
jgi:hypothetical protein